MIGGKLFSGFSAQAPERGDHPLRSLFGSFGPLFGGLGSLFSGFQDAPLSIVVHGTYQSTYPPSITTTDPVM